MRAGVARRVGDPIDGLPCCLFVILKLLSRYMRPEGPWQRFCRRLSNSGAVGFSKYPFSPAQTDITGHCRAPNTAKERTKETAPERVRTKEKITKGRRRKSAFLGRARSPPPLLPCPPPYHHPPPTSPVEPGEPSLPPACPARRIKQPAPPGHLQTSTAQPEPVASPTHITSLSSST